MQSLAVEFSEESQKISDSSLSLTSLGEKKEDEKWEDGGRGRYAGGEEEEEEEEEESLFRGQRRERGGPRARPRYPGVEDVIQSAVVRS